MYIYSFGQPYTHALEQATKRCAVWCQCNDAVFIGQWGCVWATETHAQNCLGMYKYVHAVSFWAFLPIFIDSERTIPYPDQPG